MVQSAKLMDVYTEFGLIIYVNRRLDQDLARGTCGSDRYFCLAGYCTVSNLHSNISV